LPRATTKAELRDALLVNPYDVAGVAETIHSALEMGFAERRERMRRMRRHVMEYNIYMWAGKVLGDLRELRLESAEGAEPGRVAPSGVRGAEIAAEKLA